MRETFQPQVDVANPLTVRRGTSPAPDMPPPAMLTPDQVVEQLRALRALIPNVDPLTDQEREVARSQSRLGQSPEAVQAAINALSAADGIEQAVGSDAESARQSVEDTFRWTAVEAELKALLNGVADANLLRRQRTGILAAKTYGIAKQMARDTPELRPHVKEIRRLRLLARGRKSADAPQPQAPAATVESSPESRG